VAAKSLKSVCRYPVERRQLLVTDYAADQPLPIGSIYPAACPVRSRRDALTIALTSMAGLLTIGPILCIRQLNFLYFIADLVRQRAAPCKVDSLYLAQNRESAFWPSHVDKSHQAPGLSR